MTSPLTEARYDHIDLEDLLRSRRQIASVWGTQDIREVRPDLSNDQAWEVLQECERRHDCEIGLTWSLMSLTAAELFPPPPEPGE